ncbi:MAG: hypothetical protein EZS28_022753 [Streblomastix strix]|uniref:RRM domain-containing protein n=1 Tax=Streblomastix strix TaxID=222440 RepID=A0A5J4VGM1_9EUKA|nr:MAG: hypothetical protein EZS28_022753 [Streblomastix strix]
MKSSSANKNKRARLASDTKQLKATKHPPKNIIQLLVYNMNATTKEEQLKNHIKKYGKVIQVFVPFIGKKIRGFGFVTMENNDVTLQELNNFDTKRLDGEYIRLIANENQSEFVDPEGLIFSLENIQ